MPTSTSTPTHEPGKKPITPGLYWFHNHTNSDGGQYHTGSQLTLTWRQAEPARGHIDYSRIDTWVNTEKAHGKKWVLRIDVHQNRGAVSIPSWVGRLTLPLFDGRLVEVPDYWNPQFQNGLIDFVTRLGAAYDSDPDLVLVQIGLGLYGETHPERNDTEGNLSSILHDEGHLLPCEWIDYCKRIIDAYVYAFPRTELVIMNAPTWPYPCRDTEPPYSQSWARRVVQGHAISQGVGAQNNSLDEWDANWYTCDVEGTNGWYTVDGAVSPFMDAGLMYAFERGSWLRPYSVFWHADDFQTWWSYLNALDKGAQIISPPNWAGKVWDVDHYSYYPSGVWKYNGPYAAELEWMNDFVIRAMRGEVLFWAAFDAPHNPSAYWYCTAQHSDHERGIHRLTDMASAWDAGNAKPPFYESKYMRVLNGPVTFETEPGQYMLTVVYRGTMKILGLQLPASSDWAWVTFDQPIDVPAQFTVSGTGHLHALIFKREKR